MKKTITSVVAVSIMGSVSIAQETNKPKQAAASKPTSTTGTVAQKQENSKNIKLANPGGSTVKLSNAAPAQNKMKAANSSQIKGSKSAPIKSANDAQAK